MGDVEYTQVELAVDMTCGECVAKVREAFDGKSGVRNCSIDLASKRVVVESCIPVHQLQMLVETTGKKSVITGIGSQPLSSAVAVIGYPVGYAEGNLRGLVRFTQAGDVCVVDGIVDGLEPGLHGMHVYTSGDLSGGCCSIGDHYNPFDSPHGSNDQDTRNRHLGDLGNIKADASGRAIFRFPDKHLKVDGIIGRALGVTSGEDDLGTGANSRSKEDGNSGQPIGCGIIARAASVLENAKKICLCDGTTLWDAAAASANKTQLPVTPDRS